MTVAVIIILSAFIVVLIEVFFSLEEFNKIDALEKKMEKKNEKQRAVSNELYRMIAVNKEDIKNLNNWLNKSAVTHAKLSNRLDLNNHEMRKVKTRLAYLERGKDGKADKTGV